MATDKNRRPRSNPSVKVTNSYSREQWDRFEKICQDEAGMSGRETLKQLVFYSVVSGSIPIPKGDNQQPTQAPLPIGEGG